MIILMLTLTYLVLPYFSISTKGDKGPKVIVIENRKYEIAS